MSSGTEEHLCDFCLSSPGVVKRGIINLCLKHYNLTEGVRYEADEIVEKRKIEQCKCVQPRVFDGLGNYGRYANSLLSGFWLYFCLRGFVA